MVATPFVKRKQQVLKPRGSPDMVLTLKPSLSQKRGQHRRNRQWRGIVGSAGVLARGKGTGWIAWETETSRSRPRESKPTLGLDGSTIDLARKAHSDLPGARAEATRHPPR